jgi:hypothetical protein
MKLRKNKKFVGVCKFSNVHLSYILSPSFNQIYCSYYTNYSEQKFKTGECEGVGIGSSSTHPANIVTATSATATATTMTNPSFLFLFGFPCTSKK